MLFDPDTRRRLEALRLELRRSFASGASGEAERAPGLGGRDRFREHRAYAEGDDPRRIDWNLYGQLGELHTKVFERDTDLDVEVLLDRSASMGLGAPAKDGFARRVAAGLRLRPRRRGPSRWPCEGSRRTPPSGPPRPTSGARVRSSSASRSFPRRPAAALEGCASASVAGARPRLVFVLSDLQGPAAVPAAWPGVVAARRGRHRRVDAPRIATRGRAGRIHLEDAEPGERIEAAVDEALLERYREAFRARRESQAREARRRGFAFVELEVGAAFEPAVRRLIAAAGARR
ncbi:MAG: DUF58 domain-containing protein [Planctomycetota bacterium]